MSFEIVAGFREAKRSWALVELLRKKMLAFAEKEKLSYCPAISFTKRRTESSE